MEGVYRGVAVRVGGQHRVDLLGLLLLFQLPVGPAAVLRYVDQDSEGELSPVVYYLEAEHDQQVPELNAGDLPSEDNSVLKASDE